MDPDIELKSDNLAFYLVRTDTYLTLRYCTFAVTYTPSQHIRHCSSRWSSTLLSQIYPATSEVKSPS
jgi:hypothetical protein